MNDVSPSKSELFYDPNFIAFITLVGTLLLLFGAICFFANNYPALEKNYTVLGILIVVVSAIRVRATYSIFSAKTRWVSLSLIPIVMEFFISVYVLSNHNPTFTDIRLPAAVFMMICALIHLFFAYFMKIQGLSSFSFATGLVQFFIACLIYFNRPYSELWTPWVLIGVEFLSVGAISLWLVYYSINDVVNRTFTLEKK